MDKNNNLLILQATNLFRFSTSSYCSKPKSNRWSIAVFSYLMDTTRVNIQTLTSLNKNIHPKKVNSFNFGEKLAMDLISPHLYERDLTGVPRTILLKMHLATGNDDFLRHFAGVSFPQASAEILPYQGELATKGKRCGPCMREVYTSNCRDKRKKINNLNKPNTKCERCGLVRCSKKHLHKICDSTCSAFRY